jgi:hypothetical protein
MLTSTIARAQNASNVNVSGSAVGRHSASPQRVRGFVVLVVSLSGMFGALVVGSAAALAGLALGVLGLILVGIYLLSIMVFFWELVIRTDDLGADVPQVRPVVDSEWITPDDWIAGRIHAWELAKAASVSDTKPQQIVPDTTQPLPQSSTAT